MNRSFHDNLDDTQPCRYEPNVFFPKAGDAAAVRRARELCADCHFQPDCLRYALAHDLYGIWGGATQQERQTYQKDRGITPIPVLVHGNARRPAAGRTPTQKNGTHA